MGIATLPHATAATRNFYATQGACLRVTHQSLFEALNELLTASEWIETDAGFKTILQCCPQFQLSGRKLLRRLLFQSQLGALEKMNLSQLADIVYRNNVTPRT